MYCTKRSIQCKLMILHSLKPSEVFALGFGRAFGLKTTESFSLPFQDWEPLAYLGFYSDRGWIDFEKCELILLRNILYISCNRKLENGLLFLTGLCATASSFSVTRHDCAVSQGSVR